MIDRKEMVEEIVARLERLRDCWQRSRGWAPNRVAELLEKSRLDRIVSLAQCLCLWSEEPEDDSEEQGRLVLALANLGALVEGSLVLMLCVYLSSYEKHGGGKRPDKLTLGGARMFFADVVWDSEEKEEWDPWIEEVQRRRNAIHAFRDRDIGTFEEFWSDVEKYGRLLEMIDSRLP